MFRRSEENVGKRLLKVTLPGMMNEEGLNALLLLVVVIEDMMAACVT